MKNIHAFLKGMGQVNHHTLEENQININTHKQSIGKFVELIKTILEWFAIIGIFCVVIAVGTDTHYFYAMSALGVIHFAVALTIRVMLSLMVDRWVQPSQEMLRSFRAFNNCVGP